LHENRDILRSQAEGQTSVAQTHTHTHASWGTKLGSECGQFRIIPGMSTSKNMELGRERDNELPV